MPVNVQTLGVDFLATSGYKWLLSPISTGFLYVKRNLFDVLWPTVVGYRADENPLVFSFREFSPARTARRYEDGQVNFPGFAGMKEAIGLLMNVGLEKIWERVATLRERLVQGTKTNSKLQLKSSSQPARRSGIVNLACKAPESVAERLAERGIVVSVRAGGLRISPHFYNTEGEIDKLLSELNAI
jgi:selenocysteine lyase/cysteine desulfurase